MGLKESFLKRAASRSLVEYECGLDEPVYLRSMSKGLKSKCEALSYKEGKTAKDCSDLRWMVLRECLVDSEANPLLSATERPLFDSWDEAFVEPLFNRILELSKHSEEEIEELAGN
jgi:hypothetical protein